MLISPYNGGLGEVSSQCVVFSKLSLVEGAVFCRSDFNHIMPLACSDVTTNEKLTGV